MPNVYFSLSSACSLGLHLVLINHTAIPSCLVQVDQGFCHLAWHVIYDNFPLKMT